MDAAILGDSQDPDVLDRYLADVSSLHDKLDRIMNNHRHLDRELRRVADALRSLARATGR